jgi:hypothetical protein
MSQSCGGVTFRGAEEVREAVRVHGVARPEQRAEGAADLGQPRASLPFGQQEQLMTARLLCRRLRSDSQR